MNKILLLVTLLFAFACSGGGDGQMLSSYQNTTITQDVANIQPFLEGTAQYSVSNQRTVIRTADEFEFQYRLLTGNSNALAEAVMSQKDVLMVIYTTQKFNVDDVTVTTSTNTLNIYYYTTNSNSSTKYQLYYLDKNPIDPNYVEIVK